MATLEENIAAGFAAVGADVKTINETMVSAADVYTKAEIGDITTDYVAAYIAAKA